MWFETSDALASIRSNSDTPLVRLQEIRTLVNFDLVYQEGCIAEDRTLSAPPEGYISA